MPCEVNEIYCVRNEKMDSNCIDGPWPVETKEFDGLGFGECHPKGVKKNALMPAANQTNSEIFRHCPEFTRDACKKI
jgi:hypothetical protein